MSQSQASHGWSLNQGLAAQYAAQAGIDPELAAAAGESAWDVLKALRDAADERDPARKSKRVAQTKRRLRKANLSRHRDLVKSIQERLASMKDVRPSINPATGLQEFALPGVLDPKSTSGPRTPGYWKLKWADNPNDDSVAKMAVKAAEEIDAGNGSYQEMVAIREALAQRYLPHRTSKTELPYPDMPDYDARLNEFGMQWNINPVDYGNLKPAGEAEQEYWLLNKDKPGAAFELMQRGLVIDKDGTVAVQPKNFHPNPISSAFQHLDFGIARRKLDGNPMSGNIQTP